MSGENKPRSFDENTNDGKLIEQKTAGLEPTCWSQTSWASAFCGDVFGYSLLVIFLLLVVLSVCISITMIIRHPFLTASMLLLFGFIFCLCHQREGAEKKGAENPEKSQEQVLSSPISPQGNEHS